jgi:aryl-alcohol dehydrogenase-like predicted oxidoreductase
MENRNLGTQGLSVAAIGLGCMGMTPTVRVMTPSRSRQSIAHWMLESRCSTQLKFMAHIPMRNWSAKRSEGAARTKCIRSALCRVNTRCWNVASKARSSPVMRELGIGLVPFIPRDRGFLTGGAIRSIYGMTARDFRRTLLRFTNDHLAPNERIVDVLKAVAARHRATPAQIALAWVLAHDNDVVPIPGTKRRPGERYPTRREVSRTLTTTMLDNAGIWQMEKT